MSRRFDVERMRRHTQRAELYRSRMAPRPVDIGGPGTFAGVDAGTLMLRYGLLGDWGATMGGTYFPGPVEELSYTHHVDLDGKVTRNHPRPAHTNAESAGPPLVGYAAMAVPRPVTATGPDGSEMPLGEARRAWDAAADPPPPLRDYIPDTGECRRCIGRWGALTTRDWPGHYAHWTHVHFVEEYGPGN